jgi:hypothetical protein
MPSTVASLSAMWTLRENLSADWKLEKIEEDNDEADKGRPSSPAARKAEAFWRLLLASNENTSGAKQVAENLFPPFDWKGHGFSFSP